MAELTTLPNIGKELAKRLHQVGIDSPNDLEFVGAEDAFIRLRSLDPSACMNQLFALEGAIQGIRWHSLDSLRKLELKDFYMHLRRN
jgi:DNA transformation protein and related proteins